VRKLRFTTEPQATQRSELALRRTLPLAAPGMVGNAYERADMYLVGLLKGTASAGVYGVAYKLYDTVLYPAKAVSATAIARVGHGVIARPAAAARRLALRAALMTLPLAIVIGYEAPALIRIFFGQAYGVAVGPTRLLMLASLPTAALLVLTPILVIHARAYVLSWSIAGLVGNVALNVVLVARWGVGGAAAAYVITESALVVAFVVGLARLTPQASGAPSLVGS
jgi:O-antigen/teichoic acid export membrane protein